MSNRNNLKIKPALGPQTAPLMQAIRKKSCNSLITRNSVFLIERSVKKVSKGSNRYYGVRLVQAKNGHYVEYHHKIPPDLAQQLPPEAIKKEWLNQSGQLKEWARFRIKGKLNTVSAEEYPEYAADFLLSIKLALQKGLNPFKEDVDVYKEEALQLSPVMQITKETKPSISVKKAFQSYIDDQEASLRDYYWVPIRLVEEALEDPEATPLKSLTGEDLKDILNAKREEREWSKGTYNDKVTKLRSMFSYFVEKKWISENIAKAVKKLSGVSRTVHAYYEDKTREQVKQLLLTLDDPLAKTVYRFCMTVYYTCTRPNEETRQLRCGDVNFDRDLIHIHPDRAKGGQGGRIALEPELKRLFLEMGVDKANPNDYIFGKGGIPGPCGYSRNYLQWFWREKVRKVFGLSEIYTIYSWKHTRIIHLYMAGWTPAELQLLCRHKSPTEFETYLRDLGLGLAKGAADMTQKF